MKILKYKSLDKTKMSPKCPGLQSLYKGQSTKKDSGNKLGGGPTTCRKEEKTYFRFVGPTQILLNIIFIAVTSPLKIEKPFIR